MEFDLAEYSPAEYSSGGFFIGREIGEEGLFSVALVWGLNSADAGIWVGMEYPAT